MIVASGRCESGRATLRRHRRGFEPGQGEQGQQRRRGRQCRPASRARSERLERFASAEPGQRPARPRDEGHDLDQRRVTRTQPAERTPGRLMTVRTRTAPSATMDQAVPEALPGMNGRSRRPTAIATAATPVHSKPDSSTASRKAPCRRRRRGYKRTAPPRHSRRQAGEGERQAHSAADGDQPADNHVRAVGRERRRQQEDSGRRSWCRRPLPCSSRCRACRRRRVERRSLMHALPRAAWQSPRVGLAARHTNRGR